MELLLGVPPPGRGVCRRCHGPVVGCWAECWSCRTLPCHLDALVPLSISFAAGPLNRLLRRYKDDPSAAVRAASANWLGDALERFLREHEPCVARAAQTPRFDLLCTLPTTLTARGGARARRPLAQLLRGRPHGGARVRTLLAPGAAPASGQARRFAAARYRALYRLRGESVLLVDDTWTSGASAQSAASALRRAGARRVALVVVGRHVNPAYARRAGWPARHGELTSWLTCAAHGPPGVRA